MTLHSWRIVKARFAAIAFSGEGAKIAGGRWNSLGTPVVYTAATQSLAILEMLVHLRVPDLLQHYVLLQVTFDPKLVATLDPRTLPKNWKQSPPPPSVQSLGNAWLARASSPILRIPSVIVPAESNYLLNPAHPDFSKITIGPKLPARLDPRLLKP